MAAVVEYNIYLKMTRVQYMDKLEVVKKSTSALAGCRYTVKPESKTRDRELDLHFIIETCE